MRFLPTKIKLTAKLRNDPMTLPSSYLPSLSRTLLRTEVSFPTRLVRMDWSVLSMVSSIVVWYLCYKMEEGEEKGRQLG